jgi:hypothetical protein
VSLVGVGRKGDGPGAPALVDPDAGELACADTAPARVDHDGKPVDDEGFDAAVEGLAVAN